MKQILVVHYSQTGQLSDVVASITQPLVDNPGINVVFETIQPEEQYPFPWPFLHFLSVMPESVYLDPPAMRPFTVSAEQSFDLIIVAYQVWFLSPSLPITGFLKSRLAAQLLKDKPVITLIGCRNMWLTAQEKMKGLLHDCGARLIDNVALVDEAGSIASFVATPMWMMTGKKGPWGRIPAAGISATDIKQASRFGRAICQCLINSADLSQPILTGLRAVTVQDKLIATEFLANRSFRIWGKLLRFAGSPKSMSRRVFLCVYATFLITFILTIVPINLLLIKLLAPLAKTRIDARKQYFSQPSGEGVFNMDQYL